MPIYEFRCNRCGQAASLFFRSFSTPVHPVCPSCKSEDMRKLVSRAFFVKSSLQRLEEYDVERGMGRLESEFDPGAVARWAKEMGRELGDELGADFQEMAEQVEGEHRPHDLYDPLYTFRSQVEMKRQELQARERGEAAPDWDAMGGGEPYLGAPPDSSAYDDAP